MSNETELRQALATAGMNGTYNEIRLMEGTYFTGGQKFSYSTSAARSLSISGGWYNDHDPCDFQHSRADGTIIDGQHVTAVLSIDGSISNAPGTSVSISNLTLRNGATSTNGESAALAVFGGTGQDLRVQNIAVWGSHNTTPPPQNIFSNVVTFYGYADVYFINNLIGDSDGPYANLGIFTSSTSQTVYMHNNTLALNCCSFGALLDASGGTAFRLVNNAILGQVELNSRDANNPIRLWLYDNLGVWGYHSIVTAPSIQASVGNDLETNPGFIGPLDFRPAANSPLVNRGLNAPIGGSSTFDLESNTRVDLGTIDVGAYESTRERIFANGFN
ncbi:MAG: hypothetical protein ABI451_13615 [Dokdonella sp.]